VCANNQLSSRATRASSAAADPLRARLRDQRRRASSTSSVELCPAATRRRVAPADRSHLPQLESRCSRSRARSASRRTRRRRDSRKQRLRESRRENSGATSARGCSARGARVLPPPAKAQSLRRKSTRSFSSSARP
jgi:hypothetical protein